jgi:hypothetical protein
MEAGRKMKVHIHSFLTSTLGGVPRDFFGGEEVSQEFFSGRGSKNSVEDRGQRER